MSCCCSPPVRTLWSSPWPVEMFVKASGNCVWNITPSFGSQRNPRWSRKACGHVRAPASDTGLCCCVVGFSCCCQSAELMMFSCSSLMLLLSAPVAEHRSSCWTVGAPYRRDPQFLTGETRRGLKVSNYFVVFFLCFKGVNLSLLQDLLSKRL